MKTTYCLITLLVSTIFYSEYSHAHPKYECNRLESTTKDEANWKIINCGAIRLVAGTGPGTYMKMAYDLAAVINEDQLGKKKSVRIIPTAGDGTLQNLIELKYLRAVDMAMIQSDAIIGAKKEGIREHFENEGDRTLIDMVISSIETNQVRYMMRLHDEEVHIIIRNDSDHEIKDVRGLAGKRVGVGRKTSGHILTLEILADMFNIYPKPIPVFTKDSNDTKAKLLDRSLDAIFFVGGEPLPLLQSFTLDDVKNNSLRLLPIHYNELTGNEAKIYSQAYLNKKGEDGNRPYDNIAGQNDIKTISVSSILAIYEFPLESPRYQALQKFYERFESSIEKLANDNDRYHPKWRDVKEKYKVSLPEPWERFSGID